MPWSKLKNIIILILLLTNLCLLGLVTGQSVQKSRQRNETRESAMSFLMDRGVEVDEAIIPKTIDLLPQTVERDLEGEKAAAVALLKGDVKTEAKGGETYLYTNEHGMVQFQSDGTFSAQLESGVYPIGENRQESCNAALEAIGFCGTLLKETEEGLVFRQTWKGTELFSQQVTVSCSEDSVIAFTGGQRLIGTPQADPTRQTITVPTALVSFLNGVSALGDVCGRIDKIQEGYVCSVSLSGAMSMTPVWMVTTDTGVYQMDTVTGEVKRAD